MTDLPKMSSREYQEALEVLQRAAENATVPSPSKRPWRKRCPCTCLGCEDNSHCLKPPCTRTRNRRTQAELDAAGRYVNGRVRDKAPTRPAREGLKMRTAEQIEATTGRYPNGRAKPDRSNWADPSGYRRNRPASQLVRSTMPDLLAVKPKWFVRARRNNTTVKLPAPRGRDEAYVMAGHLFMFDWKVKVIGP